MNEENKRQGFIKLYRSLLDWEWFDDVNTCHLFLYCLLRTNRVNGSWHGVVYKSGEFITSLQKLSAATGLSIQQVRTSLKKLKSTHELTYKTTNRNTIISIQNWNKYQDSNTQDNKQITNNQQTNNKQITTDKNINKLRNKEIKNVVDDVEEKIYGDYNNVLLEKSDYQKLLGIALSQKLLDECINDLSENIAQGKEQPYKADFPKAHFVRVKSYIEYRRKHPATSKTYKIRGQENFEKSMEEWRLKNG